jgi:peroxisomal 2,4-dienoyl-CoA reductase
MSMSEPVTGGPGIGSVFREGILSGQVGLVTGGGTGIGRGMVLALAAAGMDLCIASRKPEHLEATRAEVQALGRRCLALPVDVRDAARVEGLIAEAVEKLGRLDLLVNNAAGNFLAPAMGLSANAFRTVIDIDLVGTFLCAKAAFPHLSKTRGCVMNITATLSDRGTPMQSHAGSAKAGIDALTRHLAVEWGPAGVRVVAIAPGPVADTEGMRRLGGSDEGLRDRMERGIPLQRFGTCHDVAQLAVFLASPAASWITGVTYVIDGGQRLSWAMGEM